MFFQTVSLELSSQGLALEWTVKPGPLLANWIWSSVDQNQNNSLEPDELGAWSTDQAFSELLIILIDLNNGQAASLLEGNSPVWLVGGRR